MKTNSLVYTATKTGVKETITVFIRLDDECKNGHQDFSVTGEIYQTGKPRTDKNMISCGCVHEDVLKAFPEFKQFVDLHLCDYLGNPMHATANGYYHLTNGFNNMPATNESFPVKFCEYYRISAEDFKILSTAKSQTHYATLLISLGIPAKWKAQADQAIKALEELTGNEFVVDSTKTQLGMPTEDEIKTEKERIASGYYSEEQETKRADQAKADFILKLREETAIKIGKLENERDIQIMLFELGGKKLMENAIYYSHSQELGFNWRGYGNRIEEAEAKEIFEAVNAKYPLKGYKMR